MAEAEAAKAADQEALDSADSKVAPIIDSWSRAAGVVMKVKKNQATPNYARILTKLLSSLSTLPYLEIESFKVNANSSGGAIKKAYFKVRSV